MALKHHTSRCNLSKAARCEYICVVCESVEDGFKEKARRGAERPCPSGLSSEGSVVRETAGETEPAAETTLGQHQYYSSPDTERTVSSVQKIIT